MVAENGDSDGQGNRHKEEGGEGPSEQLEPRVRRIEWSNQPAQYPIAHNLQGETYEKGKHEPLHLLALRCIVEAHIAIDLHTQRAPQCYEHNQLQEVCQNRKEIRRKVKAKLPYPEQDNQP